MGRLENNLLSADNESFDASTGGWSANNNCTIARDTGTFFSPPGSLKLTTTAAGFTNAILAGGIVLVQPGTTFTVGYQAFSATAGLSCQINVDWYDATGTYVSSAATTSQPIGTSTWTLVSNVVTSPATAAEARFTVGNFTAAAGGQTLFVDDVLFAVAGPVTPVSYPGWPTWAIQPPAPVPVAQPQIERGNDFSGGTAGTTITTANSGGSSGDPFGAVSIPSGGMAVFGSDGIARFSSRATAGSCYGEWGTSGNGLAGLQDSPVYMRGRVRLPTLPPDATGIPFAVVTDSATAFQADFRVNSTGQLVLRSGAGTVLATSTTTITAGVWFEVGCAVTNVSATTGSLQLLIYNPLTGDVLEQLDAGGVDTLRGSGRQKILIGSLRSLANAAVEFDVWRVSTTSYPPLAPATILATVNEISASASVTGNTATITTASYTPGSNSLLVALVAMGNGAGSASSLGAVTDNLSGTWTRLAGDVSTTGGDAEVWVRDVGNAAAMSITWDPGGAGASGLVLIVKNYSGAKAAASQLGATAVNGGTAAYTTALTTTVAGSVIAGSLGRATDAQTLTALAGSTILAQVNGTSGDTAGLFRATAMTTAPGAGTYGFGNAAAGTNRMALAEVVPVAVPAAALPLSAAGASSTAGVADLTMTGSLAAAGTSATSAAASLTATSPLAASGASASSAAAAATALGVLSASGASASSAAASVTARGALLGTGASATAGTAAAIIPGGISAAGASTSSATAVTTMTGVLSAAAASVSTGSAALTQTSAAAATGASTSAATAAIATRSPLAATGTSTTAATAATVQQMPIGAAGASTTSATANSTRVTPISAAGSSTTSAAADITITSGPQTFPLSAAGASASTGSAAATARGVLSASGISASSATATISTRFTLSAAGASASAATAQASAWLSLSGAGNSASAASASLIARAALAAAGASFTSATALLGYQLPIGAAGASATSGAADLVLVGPTSGVTPRPNTGTTARPGSGSTPRPSTGTTSRTASGITYRPNTGTTPRP